MVVQDGDPGLVFIPVTHEVAERLQRIHSKERIDIEDNIRKYLEQATREYGKKEEEKKP